MQSNRLESMVLARKGVPGALQLISNEMLASQKPVLRGDVNGPLWADTETRGFPCDESCLPARRVCDLKIGATVGLDRVRDYL
jgi:hypothetical protein